MLRRSTFPSLLVALLAVCLHGQASAQAAAAPGAPASAAPAYPAAQSGDFIARDFKFASGETLPELRIHYTTVGNPKGEPVLILHGTNGSGAGLLVQPFAGELFGPGQPLDASRYYIILPDGIGTGQTSKPSDGLRMKFPKYNYDDMVSAQYRLMTEHLKVPHVRMVLGYSMGGMQAWLWAEQHPRYLDIAVPMASLPVAMSGRNWMMRRLIIDSIRSDPEWQNGNYTKQPRTFKLASVYFGVAANGGSQALYRMAPTSAQADRLLDERMAAPFPADANDHLLQYEASRDFDPNPKLETIQATVLAINSADDERNPPELGVMEKELKRIRSARYLLVPGSELTGGHGTNVQAKYWKKEVGEVLQSAPRIAP